MMKFEYTNVIHEISYTLKTDEIFVEIILIRLIGLTSNFMFKLVFCMVVP